MTIYPGIPLAPNGPPPSWIDWMPVGVVLPYAGIILPPGGTPAVGKVDINAWGWMPCDGGTLETKEYPYLFAVLGYLYGGSDDQFVIPDYRGYFMRGLDPDQVRDQDPREPPDGGNGDDPGSTQEDAFQDHQHKYTQPMNPATPGGDAAPVVGAVNPNAFTSGAQTGGLTNPVKVSQYETRPMNVAVNFIIKYTYMSPGGLGPFSPWYGGDAGSGIGFPPAPKPPGGTRALSPPAFRPIY